MCGIAGYSGDFDPALLDRMNAAIAHRGPDDSGTLALSADGVGLAMKASLLSALCCSPSYTMRLLNPLQNLCPCRTAWFRQC